jgi:hypothetical protein
LLLDSLFHFCLLLSSPDIFQVCCNTWNSSLNRRELFEHLRIAHSKGGMVFQAEEAETTRRFLKSVLDGKGIPAECTLPSVAAVSAATAAAANVLAVHSAAKAVEMAAKGLSAPLQVTAEAIAAAAMHMFPTPSLQTMSNAHNIFLGVVLSTEPLWFHPFHVEQLSMHDSSKAIVAGGLQPASASHHDSPSAASASATIDVGSGSQQSENSAEATRLNNAASSPQPEASSVPVVSSGRKGSNFQKKVKQFVERSPLQTSLLGFVQFLSIAQPATTNTPAIPSVVICNTLRLDASTRFGALDSAAVAAIASTFAAAAATPAPPPRIRNVEARSRKARSSNAHSHRKASVVPASEEDNDNIGTDALTDKVCIAADITSAVDASLVRGELMLGVLGSAAAEQEESNGCTLRGSSTQEQHHSPSVAAALEALASVVPSAASVAASPTPLPPDVAAEAKRAAPNINAAAIKVRLLSVQKRCLEARRMEVKLAVEAAEHADVAAALAAEEAALQAELSCVAYGGEGSPSAELEVDVEMTVHCHERC